MAQQVKLIDDLDGSDAVETVRFALMGEAYELDLSQKNLDALHKALDKYIAAARPPTYEHPEAARRRGRPAGSTNKATRTSEPTPEYDKAAYRDWAAEKGYTIPTRGRQPRKYIDEFLAS